MDAIGRRAQQAAEKPRARHREEADGLRGNPGARRFSPILRIATATSWPRDDNHEGLAAARSIRQFDPLYPIDGSLLAIPFDRVLL
jgi:hypothetical protein